jgi:hypothetical protein
MIANIIQNKLLMTSILNLHSICTRVDSVNTIILIDKHMKVINATQDLKLNNSIPNQIYRIIVRYPLLV